jgi:magnesium transporter
MNAKWTLSQEFLRTHPLEAARALEKAAPDGMAAFLEKMPLDVSAAVFLVLDPRAGAECLSRWPTERTVDVLTEIPPASATRILRLMDQSEQERIVARTPDEVAGILRVLLQYPDNTAAALMDTQIVAYQEDLSIGDVWKRLKRDGTHIGFCLYVVDAQGLLVGTLGFGEFLLAHAKDTLRSVMRSPPPRIFALARPSGIVEHPAWKHFPELPVVDEGGLLLGSIRYTTIRQLELQGGGEEQPAAWQMALALGELYWTGSSSILRGLAEVVQSPHLGARIKEKRDGR